GDRASDRGCARRDDLDRQPPVRRSCGDDRAAGDGRGDDAPARRSAGGGGARQDNAETEGDAMNGVLVVDNKELMRDSVSTMLARAGMNVRVAADAPTALKMIAGKRPDCILSDLKMPGMTGIELLAEVRKVDERLPVILMTAFATVQTAVEAMKQGAFDYITKPFDGDELVMTVRRALEHAALLRENAV